MLEMFHVSAYIAFTVFSMTTPMYMAESVISVCDSFLRVWIKGENYGEHFANDLSQCLQNLKPRNSTLYTVEDTWGFHVSLKLSMMLQAQESLGVYTFLFSLPEWLSGKESACNAGDLGCIPGSGRSPGEGNGNPLQYSCLGKPMHRGAWWATVHGVTKSQT